MVHLEDNSPRKRSKSSIAELSRPYRAAREQERQQ